MFKKLWEWIKHPHGWQLVLFYVFAAGTLAGSITFIVIGQHSSYYCLAYILYALAAISLGYTVYTVVIFVPKIKQRIVELLKKREFTARLYEQYGFRTIVFAVVSFGISVGYAIFNGVVGIVYSSLWYGVLGIYYLLLAVMRGGVLLYHRKKRKYEKIGSDGGSKIREIKAYRACGIWLVLLPVALSGVILQTVVSYAAFVRAGLMIYASAAYTFYKMIMSIVNFVKARRGGEYTVRAIRNINLADALVSVLALQTAMFHEFSPESSLGYANAIMGGIVCALTVGIGLTMIINGSIKIKKSRKERKTENERQDG